MKNTDMLLLLLLCGGFGLLLVIALVKYLMGYCADLKYVKMEMDRADDWNEYVYWHRELSALRWSIIPGVTPERVKRIRKNMKNLLYRGKYAQKEEKSDGLSGVLLPSVLGICLCAVCLAGSTFAWFTASQSTATQTIQAANYEVSAVVKSGETEVAAENDTYSLEIGEYAVTLTAAGDATAGYCVITVGDTEIYRGQLKPEESFSFTLVANEATALRITYQWGTAANPHSSIQDGTYTQGEASQAVTEPPDEAPVEDTEATEITNTPQQTEEATEPPVTKYNEVPTTESEVTAPPETEGNTEATESETIE